MVGIGMMINVSNKFLNDVEAAIERHDYHVTHFGREAVGDPNFVFQVRDGRSPTMRTVERVYSFIRKLDEQKADGST